MKRLVITTALICLTLGMLWFPPPQAKATVCSGFYTWQTQDLISAGRLNTINSVVAACGNNVDSANVGSNGFNANNIKNPSGAGSATFGGSVGYLFGGYGDSIVPLTVNGNSATQSAHILDVFQSSASLNLLAVTPTGTVLTDDADAHVPLTVNGHSATQSGDVVDVVQSPAGATLAKVTGTGTLDACPLIAAANLCAPAAPVYTVSGTAAGASYHWDKPVQFITDLNGACGAGLPCTLDSSTQTLAGAGAFLDTTFECVATDSGAAASFNFGAVPASASSVTIHVRNVTNASIGDEASVTATLLCGGP